MGDLILHNKIARTRFLQKSNAILQSVVEKSRHTTVAKVIPMG
jgi:hypothetical protein